MPYIIVFYSLSTANGSGFVKSGIESILKEESFTVPSHTARNVINIAKEMKKWIEQPENNAETKRLEENLMKSIESCFTYKGKIPKKQREKMWSAYHTLHTSANYLSLWKNFCKTVGAEGSPIFCQYIGDHVLKELAKLKYPISTNITIETEEAALTYEERNGLRYAAGYVPRSLKKKLYRSSHQHKEVLISLLRNLLDERNDDFDDSTDWISLIDRGGLKRVNNDTYQLFVALETQLRKQINSQHIPLLGAESKQILLNNDNVQFFWSIVCTEWEEEIGNVLLEMIVNEWVTIRGFSYANNWIEKYKQDTQTTTGKSKGLRKQLLATKSE